MIGDIRQLACLDSGATCSCISQELYERVNCSRKNKLFSVPASNVFCVTAIGRQRQRVKSQCVLPINIQGREHEIICLVVPKLTSGLIIGVDSLYSWESELDFENQKLIIREEGKRIEIPFHHEQVDRSTDKTLNNDELMKDEEFFFVEKLRVEGNEVINCIRSINDNYLIRESAYEHPEMIEFIEIDTKEGSMIIEDEPVIGRPQEINITQDSSNCLINSFCTHEYAHINELSHNPAIPRVSPDVKHNIETRVQEAYNLDKSQKEKLYNILMNNKDVFSESPGTCNSYAHRLEIMDDTPFNHKSRIIPLAVRDRVDLVIEEMLKDEVIEPSNSPYLNPLCIVGKKDGSLRLTIDGRSLNARTAPNHFRTENVDQLLTKFSGARYFSTIDLSQSYWQIPLDPDSRDYTAFLHKGRQYRFKKCPFGLSSSGSGLLRALHNIFGDEINSFAAQFIDDFAIASQTFEEHMQHINYILTKLQKNGFTVKIRKSQFCKKEIQFLGYVIDENGVRASDDRIQSILNFPSPRNVKQLRRFLGMCLYQSRFLINHAKLVDPLRHLLKKGNKYRWTDEEEKAFKELKKEFCGSILLHHIDPRAQFIIQSDASLKGLAAVLLQRKEDGTQNIIATASRGLRNAEYRYFSSELEIAAVHFALLKFRQYIFQKKIILQTDHLSLAFIHKCRLTSSRLSRWIHEIASYDIAIEHIKGKMNIFADAISRNPLGGQHEAENPTNANEILLGRLNKQELKEINAIFKNMSKYQREDPELIELINKANEIGNLNNDKYGLHEEILYKLCGKENPTWKTWIPKALQEKIILAYHHELGHTGSEKVGLMIEQHFYCKHLQRQIRRVISKCDLCQKAKPLNVQYDIEPQAIIRDRPRSLIAVDVHGPMPVTTFGHQYIFIMYDVFTKYVRLYPMRTITSKACLNKVLKDYISTHGKIESIISDNATIFQS